MTGADIHLLHEKALDEASELDREWFEEHPEEIFRLRYPIDFEFNEKLSDPPEGHTWRVLVAQLSPNVRARTPISLPAEAPNEGAGDDRLASIFEMVTSDELEPIKRAVRERMKSRS